VDDQAKVADLKSQIRVFCEAGDWDQFHGPKDLAIGLATEDELGLVPEVVGRARQLSPRLPSMSGLAGLDPIAGDLIAVDAASKQRPGVADLLSQQATRPSGLDYCGASDAEPLGGFTRARRRLLVVHLVG